MKLTDSFQFDKVQGFKFGSWPFGRPRMFSHVYFVDGLLIDTGHSNMRKAVYDVVSSLPLEQIYITHHHEDHTGNLTFIQKQLACPAFSSARCAVLMKNPPPISFAQWLTWGKSTPNFKLKVEEENIRTSQYHFELIAIPGHAVDMVCLYEANEGWLFSADLFVSEYIRYFMRSESMKQQIESIQKVLKKDFDVMFCGHNPQFKNGKQKLRNKLEFLQDFYGNVVKRYENGFSVGAIARDMGLKKKWSIRLLSGGELSPLNMIRAVIRDETEVNGGLA